jgi:hypothetical protein
VKLITAIWSAPRTDQARMTCYHSSKPRSWRTFRIAIAATYRRAALIHAVACSKTACIDERARRAQTSGQRIHVFGGNLVANSGHSASTMARLGGAAWKAKR